MTAWKGTGMGMGRYLFNIGGAVVLTCVFLYAAHGQESDVPLNRAGGDVSGVEEGLSGEHFGLKPERDVSSVAEEGGVEAIPKRGEIQTVLGVLTVQDADVREVLETVAVDSGLEITMDDDVQGRVSVYLKEVDVYDALRIILDMNALAYNQEPGGRMHVMTAEKFQKEFGRAFGEDVQTKVVVLQYAEAQKVQGLLETLKSPTGKVMYNEMNKTFILIDAPASLKTMEDLLRDVDVPVEEKTFELRYKKSSEIAVVLGGILTSHVGRVEFDENRQTVTVEDTPAKLQEAAKIIEGLDQPPQEILVETKTIQVVLNDENQKGIDWEAILSDYKAVDFPGLEADKKNRMSVGTVTDEDFVVLLEALDTVGAIHTVASNKVSTTDNQKIDIVIRAVDLLSVSEKEGDVGDEEMARYEATPSVADNGNLSVRVMPQGVGAAETDTEGEIFIVPEGTTIVVGGLFKEVTVEAVSKIPFLGDLPFLGFAFRRHGQRFCETEVITFLTPRVVVKE